MSRFACALALTACLVAPASAQDKGKPPALRLDGLTPGGARTAVTEAWSIFDVRLSNPTDRDRTARVLFFYDGNEDLQFGRDVWVPARSSLATWLLAGPVPPSKGGMQFGRDIRMQLYDRTDGKTVWIRPDTEERFRTRGVPYRKRETTTSMLVDPIPEVQVIDDTELPRPPGYTDEVSGLVRAFRGAAGLSSVVSFVPDGSLPVLTEGFDGIDHLVISSNRIAGDRVGLRALRQWLVRGGRAWVLLDRVEPETLATVLGDALDFQLVDRVALNSFDVVSRSAIRTQEHERPLDFARVLLPPGESPPFTIDGWPIWFTRNVGRGKVIFSTLGPRGMARPIMPREKAVFPEVSWLPVPHEHLEALSVQLQQPTDTDPMRPQAIAEAFQKPLEDEIGYSVIGLGTVAGLFGGFLVAFLVVAFAMRGRREWLIWLAPGLAVFVAALFVLLGERTRRAVPPTVVSGQVVDVAPGVEEVNVNGIMAVYRPTEGEADLGGERGGLFEIDRSETKGQARRFISTDLGAWHWEGMRLPVGVRLAPFHTTTSSANGIRAVARFGPTGVEGELTTGAFANPSDAVIVTFTDAQLRQGQRHPTRGLALQLNPDGKFRTASKDALPLGHFLAGSLLDDRQQQREKLYRQLATVPGSHLRGRTFLLAWADPLDPGFRLTADARRVGNALLIIPLEYAACEANAAVTIPGPLVGYRRVKEGMIPSRITTDGPDGLEQRIRFQIPKQALPMRIERVTLMAHIAAPSRQVTILGEDGKTFAEVYRSSSPMDPMQVTIDRADLLKLDEDGGLHLSVKIGDLGGAKSKDGPRDSSENRWKINYLELEVVGRKE